MPPKPTRKVVDWTELFTVTVDFLRQQPRSAVERLRQKHASDGSGCCMLCTGGGDGTGRHRWPCTIRRATSVALGITSERGALHVVPTPKSSLRKIV